MIKNYEYRKKKCKDMQKYSLGCSIRTEEFFCAYKCPEGYQLKRHMENHRNAIDTNEDETNGARFYEFPLSMINEIQG